MKPICITRGQYFQCIPMRIGHRFGASMRIGSLLMLARLKLIYWRLNSHFEDRREVTATLQSQCDAIDAFMHLSLCWESYVFRISNALSIFRLRVILVSQPLASWSHLLVHDPWLLEIFISLVAVF